jgi:hypothetical protein
MFFDTDADIMLFLEDDLEFNQHIAANLSRWTVMRRPWFRFGSLYNPNIGVRVSVSEANYFIADPNCVYGSQAFLLSRSLVEYLIQHWESVPGMQDIKISRLAAKTGADLYYHTPSLVQHVGRVSSWTTDNRFHQAADYKHDFLAQ